jgi:RHS repeat-associated protein
VGTNTFHTSLFAVIVAVSALLAFSGNARAGGGNDPAWITQPPKIYNHFAWTSTLPNLYIYDKLQSDDFGFQPAPGNYRAIINGGQWTDFGRIAGWSSPQAASNRFPCVESYACLFYDPSSTPDSLPTGYEVPASQITVVGNRLQVNISATACHYTCYINGTCIPGVLTCSTWAWDPYEGINDLIGYSGVSITWIAKCDNCGSGACGQPGASQHQNQCVNSSFSLGQTAFGASAGQLQIYSLTPSPQLATPAGLQAFTASGVQVITNGAGVRQVLAPQELADIVTNNAYQYQINFYSPGNFSTNLTGGLYQPTGSAFKTVTILNVDGASDYNHLRITESDTGVQTDYTWNQANQQWTLITGSGLRQETRSVQWQANTLTETDVVSDATGKVATKTVFTYQVLPGATNVFSGVTRATLTATNLVQSIADPDGANPLTNQWLYYTDTNNAGYGQLQMSIDPNGHWVRYEYDAFGQVTNQVSQFMDAPTNAPNSSVRVVSTLDYPYSQNANQFQKQTVTYLLGQEVGRTYEIDNGNMTQLIQAQVPGAATNDPNNLVTTTVTYPAGNAFEGRTQSITQPDGTLNLYTYTSSGTAITTVLDAGAPSMGATSVVDGTRTVTVNDLAGNLISQTTTDIASVLLVSQQSATQADQFGRPTEVISLGGTNYTSYTCCGVGSMTTAEGITTTYQYDLLRRVTATTVAGITTTNSFDADGRNVGTVRIGSDSSAIQLNTSVYDLAGRLTYSTNALQHPTTYTETRDSSNHLVRTTINPDQSTRVETYYLDGQLLSLTGTAVHGITYVYGVDTPPGESTSRAFTQAIDLNSNGSPTGEWTKTYTDMLGRPYKVVHADNSYSLSVYNNKGQLVQQTDEDGDTTLYTYNAKGQLETTAIDMNNNGTIDFGGTDRITQTENSVVSAHGTTVQRTTTAVWPTLNTDSSNVISTVDTSIDGLQSWTINYGLTSQSQTAYAPAIASRTVTATAPDGSQTVSAYQNGRLTSSVSSAGALTLGSQSYSYDPHGRLAITTDNRTSTQTTNTYDKADEVLSTTVIAPSLPVQATSYQYDLMGRQTLVTLPDNGVVSNAYYSTGELATNSGARTYPVAYTYDYAGRMKTLTTWQNYAGNTGNATTTWSYDAQRGLLASKAYADSSSVTYSNSFAGRLLMRQWVRGITTTYAYTPAGDLGTITYSDGTTPNVTFGFDRQGRTTSVTDGTGPHALTYNDPGQLLTESFPNSGAVVTNSYDGLLRRATLAFPGGTATYGYDAASRLNAVTNGAYTASYTYLPYSSLVSNLVFKSGGAARMTTTKTWDNLNRLSTITSGTGITNVSSFAYQYNLANQRTQVTLADGSYWIYTYDSLGQVTSGSKYWSDGSLVSGQQFGYNFDTIGNRKTATFNSNTGTYTDNSLNEYSQSTVPGYVWELGNAASNATVTVNLQPTTRKGQYFSEELSVNNSSSAVYTQLVTVGVLKNGGSNQMDIVTATTGKVFVAQSPEIFGYDLDGNLTNDGRWTYNWDAENRLIQVQTLTNLPASVPQEKLLFGYDYQGRRVSKVVSNFNGGTWSATTNLKFIWDGWNLIAEINSTNGLVRSYAWGLDISGSQQNAGGVGGLLMFTQNTPQPTNCFAAFDGNGNVTTLLNADTGTITASYDFGPFGEALRDSGSSAKANPFRFSTKYQDDETGLLYYGNRYLGGGRWLSRDPVEEAGAPNLYAFVSNDAITRQDYLGLWTDPDRHGEATAEVTAECGDTVASLAYKLHLSAADYFCWLKLVSGEMPNSEYDTVKPGSEFTIPNTVYLNYGQNSPGIDPFNLDIVTRFQSFLSQQGNRYAAQGFKIVTRTVPTEATMKQDLSGDDIYAFGYAGHGVQNGLAATSNSTLWPEQYTQYGIAWMLLMACETMDSNVSPKLHAAYGVTVNLWQANVSQSGVVIGWQGSPSTLNPNTLVIVPGSRP